MKAESHKLCLHESNSGGENLRYSFLLLVLEKKNIHKFVNIQKLCLFLQHQNIERMKVLFDKEYLGNLYEKGDSGDKKHRYQPQVVKKYKRVVDLMIDTPDVLSLAKYNSLHYEKLVGDKAGLSSVRVNDQYRIEFEELKQDNEVIATICNITELSNHYQ